MTTTPPIITKWFTSMGTPLRESYEKKNISGTSSDRWSRREFI